MRTLAISTIAFCVTCAQVLAVGNAHALSCVLVRERGFVQCNHGRCEPLFGARFQLTGDGCDGRWIVEAMEPDVATRLLDDIARRDREFHGQLMVEFREALGYASDEDRTPEPYLEDVKIAEIPGSPEEIRETWDAKASEGLYEALRMRSIGWAWALALLGVLYVTSRRVWSSLRGRKGRWWTLALALAIQMLGLLVAWHEAWNARMGWSNRLDPVWSVVLLGATLLALEVLALAIKTLRGILRTAPRP